ncbi:TVP38/TMEM64 family protein [Bacillus sp. TH13]|uniref:TVP38/TMEM64 family protein n=1 Tax=Bacillus sp. TH13 TaxID=2796379 RepID=UPI001911F40B|nr:TVP38/TMEM64 family protein [Bacillus sp. TH13]MBK5491834.1 TVP38/TMEM64 family protein [Bacillus sp. TH13]
MDFQTIKKYFSVESMDHIVEIYKEFGPLLGIGLPMIEAFIPPLPILVFVFANAIAFGFWFGFLYSWIGVVIGAMLVFLIIRSFGRSRFFSFVNKHERVRKTMGWIERKGFVPLFVIFCFPVGPSALINVVAGLSRISVKQFGLALAFGKFVKLFILTYIGYDLMSLIHKPVKWVIVGAIISALWYIGKKIEVKLELH